MKQCLVARGVALGGLYNECLTGPDSTQIKRVLKVIDSDLFYNFGQLDNPYAKLCILTSQNAFLLYGRNKNKTKIDTKKQIDELLNTMDDEQPEPEPEPNIGRDAEHSLNIQRAKIDVKPFDITYDDGDEIKDVQELSEQQEPED